MLLGWRASLSRPGQRETNRMGDRYNLWVRSGFPGPLGATHRRRSYLPQVVARRWDRRSQSPSGSGCLGTGVLALGHETVGFVFLGPVALVLSLCVFFVKNLLSSWYLGVGVALALTLARLLLRDFGPLVPRSLIPGLWWLCWSWVARSCSPGQITVSVLVPGSWTWLPCLSPAVRLPPMGWLGWWVCVCLHFLKWCLYYFMEI